MHAPSLRPFARIVFALLGALLVFGSLAPAALAAEIRQGPTVVVGPTERIDDDLYAFGSSVTILGTVNGDVFAAGNVVSVGGTVTGDVFAAGNTTTITADVKHSVRAAGGTVSLSGPIGDDALVGGGTLAAAPTARVGRDLLIGVGSATLGAPVARNVLASGGDITLSAPVGGDMRGEIGTLRLANGGNVQGTVTYTSDHEADIAPGVIVGGIERIQPVVRTQPTAAFGWSIVDWLRGLVGLAALGLVLVGLFPRFTQRTADTLTTSIWTSLGLGFAVFVAPPVLAVLVFGVGILVGGWWLGFMLLAAYAMALVVGYTFAAVFAGRWAVQVLRQPKQALLWNLIEGLALFGLLGLVPFVGGVLLLLATVLGMGAVTLTLAATYRRPAAPSILPALQPVAGNGVLSHT